MESVYHFGDFIKNVVLQTYVWHKIRILIIPDDQIRKAASVKKVKASHKKGEAVILSEEPLNETDITKAVNDTGYSVTGYLSRPYVKKGLFGRS